MKEARGDRAFLFGVYAFLVVVILVIAIPVVYIVAASFSSASAVLGGKVWLWPVGFTLTGYKAVFDYPEIWTAYLNSIIYALGSAALAVVLTVMMAYPLARRDFYGRRFFIWLLIFAFMFNGGIIPFYLVVQELGMVNTPFAMIFPTGLNVFWVILAKTYFQSSIPPELYNAAQVDGCGDIRFLTTIVLPISKPLLAVVGLLAAVTSWNSYFYALIFLNSQSLYPLQLVLQQLLVLGNISPSGFSSLSPEQLQYFQNLETLLKYSLVVVASVPMLVLYPFAQKHFTKGVLVGSLKD
ncbi:MAG TPA: carbohydrate ABC transporter permease [Acidimicrobiales bacterium]|nr:carbohydrate ABC transporter permease [Acidimicrobiales bacterium]